MNHRINNAISYHRNAQNRQSSSLRQQQGLGIIGWLVTLSIAGLLATTAIQLTPVYIEYFTIKKTMENMQNDSSLKGATNNEIFNSFAKRLDISQIRVLKPREDYSVKKIKGKNAHALTVDYEVRRKLLGNVSLIAAFNHSVEVGL